jgi:hypothetical protein
MENKSNFEKNLTTEVSNEVELNTGAKSTLLPHNAMQY